MSLLPGYAQCMRKSPRIESSERIRGIQYSERSADGAYSHKPVGKYHNYVRHWVEYRKVLLQEWGTISSKLSSVPGSLFKNLNSKTPKDHLSLHILTIGVQSFSCVQLILTPRTATHLASLSFNQSPGAIS